MCRVRRAKANLELNFTKVTKNKMKSFYRYVNQKRKVKESIYSLISKAIKLVTRMRRRLRCSENFLPQPSLAASLPHNCGVNGL